MNIRPLTSKETIVGVYLLTGATVAYAYYAEWQMSRSCKKFKQKMEAQRNRPWDDGFSEEAKRVLYGKNFE